MADEFDEQPSHGWEDYWSIAVRRRWWILLPLFLCWSGVWGISWLLPAQYQSEALILLEEQKVPDQYVVPNVTLSLQDRLQSVTQQILSRTRLQRTIERFHLYSQPHGPSTLWHAGDPVDQMRGDIKIELVDSPGHPGEFTAFKIQYSAGSPQIAQQVNSELTSLFIEENVATQQQLSENTTTFLNNQLEDARAKMQEQEANVAAFKAKHLGDLPTQLESNVQILVGLQAQLQNTQQALDGAKQNRLFLESLLQQYQSVQANLVGDSAVPSAQALNKQLLDLRLQLQDLRSRYTENYPDIVVVKDKIATIEKQEKAIETRNAATQDSPKTANSVVDPAAVEEVQRGSSTPMMQVQSQLEANQLEIQNYQQHEKALETQISGYQTRLNMTPETEQALADISRGYEESKSNYNSLLQKQMQSQLATSLEKRQQGEQFRILDPPNLPDRPSAPNHLRISLGGLALGLVVGLSLAVLLELVNVRVRKEKDLEGVVPVRVLVGIPLLKTPREDHLSRIARRAELGAAVAIVILIAVGNLYSFYNG